MNEIQRTWVQFIRSTELAMVTRPEGIFSRGVLRVLVRDRSRLAELQAIEAAILKRLPEVEEVHVRAIEWATDPVASPKVKYFRDPLPTRVCACGTEFTPARAGAVKCEACRW